MDFECRFLFEMIAQIVFPFHFFSKQFTAAAIMLSVKVTPGQNISDVNHHCLYVVYVFSFTK